MEDCVQLVDYALSAPEQKVSKAPFYLSFNLLIQPLTLMRERTMTKSHSLLACQKKNIRWTRGESN